MAGFKDALQAYANWTANQWDADKGQITTKLPGTNIGLRDALFTGPVVRMTENAALGNRGSAATEFFNSLTSALPARGVSKLIASPQAFTAGLVGSRASEWNRYGEESVSESAREPLQRIRSAITKPY